jgi:hypothetical protein
MYELLYDHILLLIATDHKIIERAKKRSFTVANKEIGVEEKTKKNVRDFMFI